MNDPDIPDDAPKVVGVVTYFQDGTRAGVVVKCPYCSEEHLHGDFGPRVSHCEGTDKAHQYWIVEE